MTTCGAKTADGLQTCGLERGHESVEHEALAHVLGVPTLAAWTDPNQYAVSTLIMQAAQRGAVAPGGVRILSAEEFVAEAKRDAVHAAQVAEAAAIEQAALDKEPVQFTAAEAAKAAYRGYSLSTGGKTFDGRPMPRWEELPARIQQAWELAVCHALANACFEDYAGAVATLAQLLTETRATLAKAQATIAEKPPVPEESPTSRLARLERRLAHHRAEVVCLRRWYKERDDTLRMMPGGPPPAHTPLGDAPDSGSLFALFPALAPPK